MKNNATLAYSFVLIIGDFLALLAAFSAAYILRVKFDTRPLIQQIPAISYLYTVAAVLPLWIAVNALIGLYNQSIYERRFAELGRLLIGSVIGVLIIIGYNFVTDGKLFPARLVPVYGLAIGLGFLVLFRTITRILRRWLYSYGVGVSNVLIIGDTKVSHELARSINVTKITGQHVVGLVGCQESSFEFFETFEEALEKLGQSFNSIVQTELYRDQGRNNAILQYAQTHHLAYRFVPGNTDLFVGKISVELFGGLPMIAVHQTALIGWGRVAKRIFDLIVALIIAVVTLPLTILIALAIKIYDGKGPVFFRQTRLTRFNREFGAFKFRTLKATYSGMSPEDGFKKMGKPELAIKYRENGDYLPNDPRYSVIGRLLYRTSLDELPQLINVLKGDISLVGPRALVPNELNKYEKRHAILSVKSGLTGLAQISGRRNISFDERRKLDIYYVQNWSFWDDLVILLKTFRAVIAGISAK